MITTIFLLALLPSLQAQALYDPLTHQPGPNLISNPLFDQPLVTPPMYYQFVLGSIPGWTCKNVCQLDKISSACAFYGKACNLTWVQAIDINSNGFFDEISQNVNIVTAGSYLVHIEWMPAFQSPIGKQFTVKINSISMMNVTTNSSTYDWNID